MTPPAFLRVFALGLALLSTARLFGQITLTIQATENFSLSYNAGDPDEGDTPSLRVSTDSIAPASLDYTGHTSGTFTAQFLAPTGFKFVIDPVDGPLTFDFQVAYTTYLGGGASGGLHATGPTSFSLLGFEGTAPTISSVYPTMTDYPHAYLAVNLGGEITESFSFTGFQYSFHYTGIGADLSVPHFEGGNFSVSDNNYTGSAPPNHSAIMTLSAIPEPSTYAVLTGAAVLGVAVWRRRSRRA